MGSLLGPEDIASRHANLLRSILAWDYNDLINKQSKSLTKRRRCPHTSEDHEKKLKGDEEAEEQGQGGEEEWAEDEEDWETCRLCEEEKEHEARLYGLKHVPETFSSPEAYLAVFDALLLEEARAQIIVGDERAGAYSSGQTMLLHMAAVTAMDSASDFTRVKLGVKAESQTVLRDNDLVLLIRSDQKVDMAGGNSMPDNAFAVLEGQSWRNVLNARLYLEESLHGVPLPVRHAARASTMKRLLASSAGSPKPWWIVKICNLSTITREYLALQAIHTLPMRPFILDPKPAVAALKPCATWSVPKPLWQYLEANHNPSQLEAIQLATTNMPIALIQGPPGTGKTHTILGLLSAILHSVPTATADPGGKAAAAAAANGKGKGRPEEEVEDADGLHVRVQQSMRLQATAQQWLAASPWLTGRTDPRSVLDAELDSEEDGSDDDALPLTRAERAAARRRRHIIEDDDDDDEGGEDGAGGGTKGSEGDGCLDDRARLVASVRARKHFYYTSSASAAMSVPTVVRMLASSSRSHVLVCAPSNAALDEVVLRLITVGLHDAQGNQYIPSVVRVGVNPHHSVAAVTMDALLAERVAQVQQRASSSTLTQAAENKGSLDRLRVAILDEADIVCSTLSFSGSAVFARMSRSFDVVVVDEASQAVESSILVPLCNGTKQLIMVGDPRQLPATVLSVRATEHGYTQSMFQRVQAAGLPVALLRTQYRMHPHISRFPSEQFYEHTLEDGPDMAKATDKPWHASRLFGPFTFFDVKGAEKAAKGTGSFQNEEEALFALELYKELVRQHPRLKSGSQIGILSPYKQQVKLLRTMLEELLGSEESRLVDVNTIDGFQGREKDIILFSCVRSKPGGIGFLADARRMNVGLTRARSSMLVIGNAKALSVDDNWGALVRDSKARGRLMSVPKSKKVEGAADGPWTAYFERVCKLPRYKVEDRMAEAGAGEEEEEYVEEEEEEEAEGEEEEYVEEEEEEEEAAEGTEAATKVKLPDITEDVVGTVREIGEMEMGFREDGGSVAGLGRGWSKAL